MAALDAYIVEGETETVDEGTIIGLTNLTSSAGCQGNDVATGGGYNTTGSLLGLLPITGTLNVTQSSPTPLTDGALPTGWQADAELSLVAPLGSEGTFTAYVICHDVEP
ncbi:hypothetical protein [Streptomyces wuyuanensis]|uniref:hypothetical protein n=1 Tax=Streptomyces wuyuanensis TaxID=1196353 RepID=UPI0034421CB9